MLHKNIKQTILKNKVPIIIIICILFNILIILNYITKINNPKQTFKQINPKVAFSQKINYYKPNKIKVKDINPSVVSAKTIYLTFDDGPSALTESILNILKEENIPATFFLTSRQIDKYSRLVKRMQEENHTVALHTSTHNYSYIYSQDENYFNDLNQIRNQIYNITGHKSRIVRLPGGSSNTISRKYNLGIVTRITNKLTENDYYYFDWNVDSNDASGQQTKESIYNNVVHKIHNGTNIVLMHDLIDKRNTVEALPAIIKFAKENNYTFAKITKGTPQIHHHINN